MPTEAPERDRTPRAVTHERRRNDLIEAAIEVMAQYGSGGTSVGRIGEAAGASRGLMRHYFRTKSALLVAAFQRLSEEFEEALARGAGGTDHDGLARLNGSIEAVFRKPHYDISRRRAWFGFWHVSPSVPALRAVNESVTAYHRTLMIALLSQAAEERGIALDVQRAGVGLSMLMDGAFLALAEESSPMTPDEAEGICKLYCRMALGLMG